VKGDKKICVVIPAYNELVEAIICAETINREVSEIDLCLVIDDGSDKSGYYHTSPRSIDKTIVYHNDRNRGVGYTFIRGIGYALNWDYDYIICWTLIDRGLELEAFSRFIDQLEQNDIVTGIRQTYKMETLARRIGLWFHRLLFFLQTGRYLKDTTIGFRGYRKELFNKIKIPLLAPPPEWMYRYGFETWILLQAVKNKSRIGFVNINPQKAKNSTIRLWGKNSFLSIFKPFFSRWN